MGGVSSSLKRLVSSEARKEHAAMKERVAKRMENARQTVATRKAQQSKDAALLFQQIKDEVELKKYADLRQSLPSAPKHPVVPRK